MAKLSNPLAFTRGPVTVITTLVYLALFVILILNQTDLPSVPSSPSPFHGINLTEAWQDLQTLTAQYHPYNSRANDHVHTWLVERIGEILKDNNVSSTAAYVFEDNAANLSSSSAGSTSNSNGVSVYFEGTNIIVYVRGSEDDKKEWWTESKRTPKRRTGVLVNAHYDSVSTGYGSTDDGVGVISVIQLLRYYTTTGQQPRNGLVLLLNNGEEDFLNGARAFSQHPMSNFVASFLNLEGAGAGGRAALFRSTDEEVTRAYAKSPHPFGTVISGDAFERGLVRSQTDYVIFNGILGYRGLDVAFIGPRARYHTGQDDSRHTGQKALWHMLSAALATTRHLSKTEPITLDDQSHRSIWFDVLGRGFVLMQTHTFFALSLTVLIIGPIGLLLTMLILYRSDKLYLFSSSAHIHTADGDEPVALGGWRGLFRFPFILLGACAAPIALAYLLFKENPFIAHSSEWPVWSMMISSFVMVAWFFSKFAEFIRPSALTRAYGFGWIFIAWWLILVAALVYEEQVHLSGGYFALFYYASALFTTWLCYVEMFSLPKKTDYCTYKLEEDNDNANESTPQASASTHDRDQGNDDEENEPTERSALLRSKGRSAFKNYIRQSGDDDTQGSDKEDKSAPYDEQEWTKPMWTWMWILQLIIIVPINVIILGQLGFYLVEALHQTGQDGSSMFLVYIAMAILTIFIFSPAVPLIHRLTWHLPIFLLLVLIGTLVYNLLAFPFSAENRVKLFFQQQIDLDNGNNSVSLTGVSPFVEMAVHSIPSAAGQELTCIRAESFSERKKCSWEGLMPQVVPLESNLTSTSFKKHEYEKWLSLDTSLVEKKKPGVARFAIGGQDTRACKLLFDVPISDFHVEGQNDVDKRFPPVPEAGSKEIRLWSRTWDRIWEVNVTWDSQETKHLTGKAVCLWSEVNQRGVIPAFDETLHFVPEWVAITKFADGLLEGYKRFSV